MNTQTNIDCLHLKKDLALALSIEAKEKLATQSW